MRLFAELYRRLDETSRTGEKVAALEWYFRSAPPPDGAWALFFLSGRRLKRVLPHAVLSSAAEAAIGLPGWLINECRVHVGDGSETLALLIPPPANPRPIALHELVARRVAPLSSMDFASAERTLRDTWDHLVAGERFLYHKFLGGEFRVGVQRPLVVRGLAAAFGLDPALVAHRLSGTFAPTPEAYARVTAPAPAPSAGTADGSFTDDEPRPFPFCLAQPVEAAMTGSERFEAEFGPIDRWQVEHKWDGIRAQLVRTRDHHAVWSRGEELISGQFPEALAIAARLPQRSALDGEVIAWDFAAGRPLPFAALQRLLGRKNVQRGLFDTRGVAFIAYDAPAERSVDLRSRPLAVRREHLERLVNDLAGEGLPIILSPTLAPASWSEAARLRLESRPVHNAEGLMLKRRESLYSVGRSSQRAADGTRGGWWKWKVDPLTLDAVLLFAQPGSGRRAGLFTDYTFGLWSGPPEDPGRELVTFAKAYSGLSDEEIARLDAWVRANSTARVGPLRAVPPVQVFELGFDSVRPSTRHRAGIATRFPRILRWRTDKPAGEADTLATARALIVPD
jgi:DNA ligase-1